MRGAIRKRFSANAPLRRAPRRRKLRFPGVLLSQSARVAPFRLLFPKSSARFMPSEHSDEILFGSPVIFVFFGRFGCCDVCLYRRRADGVPRKSASAASDFLGLERRRLYIYTGTRRKPTRYSISTLRYSTVHKSICRFSACFLLFLKYQNERQAFD